MFRIRSLNRSSHELKISKKQPLNSHGDNVASNDRIGTPPLRLTLPKRLLLSRMTPAQPA